ncbi:exported hypothetical protein [Frankia sp. AiPs1]
MSMKVTPRSTARRRTARACSGSAGGPQIPGPVIRIAPNPRRVTGRSPPSRNVPLPAASVPLVVVVVDINVLPDDGVTGPREAGPGPVSAAVLSGPGLYADSRWCLVPGIPDAAGSRGDGLAGPASPARAMCVR